VTTNSVKKRLKHSRGEEESLILDATLSHSPKPGPVNAGMYLMLLLLSTCHHLHVLLNQENVCSEQRALICKLLF
jgi:hypothetical protein